jgi:hypothetical protein
MQTEALIEHQLNLIYDEYNKSHEQRYNDKKLCLIAWLTIIAAISLVKLDCAPTQIILLTTFPIVGFWYLEAGRAIYLQLWYSKIVQLENLLVQDNIEFETVRPLFLVSGCSLNARGKIKALFYALFMMESIVFFYMLLLLANALFLLFYFSS